MNSSTDLPRSPVCRRDKQNEEIRPDVKDVRAVTHKSEANKIISLLPSKQALSSDVGITMARKQETTNRKSRDRSKIYPEDSEREELDPDLKALSDRGIRVKDLEDEEDVWNTMQIIKSLPCSLTQKRKYRTKLTDRTVKQLTGCAGCSHSWKMGWKKFQVSFREFLYRTELWGTALKKIEGQQGAGVMSYFVLLRTLFKLNIVLFLLMFIFVVLPNVVQFTSDGYTTAVTGSNIGGVDAAAAVTCSAGYEVNVSSDAASVIQDFLQGTGWMEQTGLFIGWYDAVELNLGTAGSYTFTYIVPLAYLLVVVIIFIISLLVMARSSVASFKESIAKSGDARRYTYNVKLFCGWDYAMTEEHWALIKQKSAHKDIVAELAETKLMKKREAMTTAQKCGLYTKRFIINFLILSMLGGAAYLIYFVQKYSTETTSSDSIIQLLIEFLPSLTLGALNGILPLIFAILVGFEDYTTIFAMQLHLLRIVFLKLASLAMLIISVYTQITCSTKTATCNVGIPTTCTAITCWETYVGQTFYKLVVMDFLIHIVAIFAVELPRKLITTKCDSNLLKKVGPAVFDIPKSVLELIYSQMLCWIGLLFCPLITAMTVVGAFVLFYLKYFSAMKTTGAPEKPYRASRSNGFFIAILLLAFFMSVFPVGFSMVRIRPSTGCGPFRVYDTGMSTIIDATISNFPSWLNGIVGLILSASVILTIIVVLCIVIYFCSARGTAYKNIVKLLEEQLLMESRDKQFLMAKVYDLTGSKPAARKKETVSTVNESKKTKKSAEKSDVEEAPPVYRSPSPGSRPDTPKIVVNNTDWEETPTKKTSKPLEF